jgi:hypothetical protein
MTAHGRENAEQPRAVNISGAVCVCMCTGAGTCVSVCARVRDSSAGCVCAGRGDTCGGNPGGAGGVGGDAGRDGRGETESCSSGWAGGRWGPGEVEKTWSSGSGTTERALNVAAVWNWGKLGFAATSSCGCGSGCTLQVAEERGWSKLRPAESCGCGSGCTLKVFAAEVWSCSWGERGLVCVRVCAYVCAGVCVRGGGGGGVRVCVSSPNVHWQQRARRSW